MIRGIESTLSNIKQKCMEMMQRKERDKESPEKESGNYFFKGKGSGYPERLYSHKSKTFKKNKRRGY